MAMSVGSVTRLEDVTLEALLAEAKRVGVAERFARNAVTDLAARTAAAATELADARWDAGVRVIADRVGQVAAKAARTRR